MLNIFPKITLPRQQGRAEKLIFLLLEKAKKAHFLMNKFLRFTSQSKTTKRSIFIFIFIYSKENSKISIEFHRKKKSI